MVDGGPGPSLSRRWQDIGTGGHARLESADLWMLELPFLEAVASATSDYRRRPLVMVRLVSSTGVGPIEGWGECAALADARYDPEHADRSFEALYRTLLPALWTSLDGGQHLPGPAGLAANLRQAAHGTPMAFAALEMAVADAHLRAEGRSLAGVLGVEDRAVEIGAVVGVQPSERATVDRVGALAEEGFSRVKLKIEPGWDVSPLEAVTLAVPGVRLQADANGSYREDDGDQLAELDSYGLLCLEQPFGRDDLDAHARLAARLRTPICLDEGVRSRQGIAHALAVGACSVVCLKPARLGGVGEALALVESCVAGGTPLWMGGMFESGYARGVNTTLAALSGFSWPGDLSPAPTYLGADLVPPPTLTRVGDSAALAVRPPRGPGMGVAPRLDRVSRLAVRHATIGPP